MSSIEMCHSANPHSSFDFEGLEESLVDNNDDDDEDDEFPEHDLHDPNMVLGPENNGMMFDNGLALVRDALIRDSANRTEEDIEIIVRFLSAINSNHDHMTRKRLAPHFVLAEIESRDTRVLTHLEKLDAYCIVAAGSLRHVIASCGDDFFQDTIGSPVDDEIVLENGSGLPQNSAPCPNNHTHHQSVKYLHIGDEFGAHLNDRVVYGEIFTNENFVWVLCVPHVIFDEICGEKGFKTIKDEVTGNVIEMRTNCYLPQSPSIKGPNILTENDLNYPKLDQTNHYAIPDDYTATQSGNNTAAIPPKTLALPTAKQNQQPNHDNNELIRATKERLYELVLNSEPSEIFIEDFLLTFRIWSEKDLTPSKDSVIMNDLMNRICNNLRNNVHQENCVRIVLIWMANHFQDFQSENSYLLEEFEQVLKEKGLRSQLQLFYMNLSAKSAIRQVTVTRSDRTSPLPFSLIGGYECSTRMFIGFNDHPQNSPQHQPALDLRPGDRVISINGVDCQSMQIERAYELCRASTHLSLQVKYDPHLFNQLIEGRYETKRQIVETFPIGRMSSSTSSTNFGSTNLTGSSSSGISHKDGKKENSTGHMWKQKVRSLVSMTTNQLINSTSNILNNSNSSHHISSIDGSTNHSLNNSSSNSSISSSSSSNVLSASSAMNANPSVHPRILSYEVSEIIKIYFLENNEHRFLPIHSSTTARECIQLALREFQLTSNSSYDFALYEYSVIFNGSNVMPDENSVASSTVVKRLSDGTSDLVNNLGLNSRLYLKRLVPSKDSTGGHLTDNDIAKEIIKDAAPNSILALNANAIARELTARDFRLFCKIEAQQFVYDLAYNDPSGSSDSGNSLVINERTRELRDFERKTNDEMFWTVSQILEEKRSLTKRVKVIKQLIRIAHVALKLNNFNTLFAILSGLGHNSVDRLKTCWDKMANKDMKKLQKLKQIMDPSRNFYNFRQKLLEILRQDNGAFIIIPFFPLVKKDLSFIWLANQTYVNSKEPQTPSSVNETNSSTKNEMLVNWEKMRLLSEKIREIQKMTNTTSLALAAVNGLGTNGNTITSPAMANEPIDPNMLFRMFADTITSEDPKTFSNKRLWESQRMTKRVQSFLDETFVCVTSDEQELLSRSHSCELPQTPNSSHATTRSSIASTMSSNSQLSHPSPTPSSASSSSNSLSMHSDGIPGQLLHRPQRPRFGQTSPNQLRKLLALSDGSVIVPHNNGGSHNPPTHPTGSGNSGQHAHHHQSHQHQSGSSQHHYHHHHHHQYSHNIRSSNSSLNSSVSGSTSYYNNIYGCQPSSGATSHHSTPYSLLNNTTNGFGPLGNANANANYHHSSHHKMAYGGGAQCASGPQSYHHNVPPNNCCSMPTGGVLFPNQSYCSCCNGNGNSNSLLRSSLMMMPPPQTSGLMHPSPPTKQSLPVESSSVTSFRRLEQYQQITRYRELRHTTSNSSSNNGSSSSKSQAQAPQSGGPRRPQCPDYDTAIQRICGGSSAVTVNGVMASGNNTGNKSANLSHGTHHQSGATHHREDIV